VGAVLFFCLSLVTGEDGEENRGRWGRGKGGVVDCHLEACLDLVGYLGNVLRVVDLYQADLGRKWNHSSEQGDN
jgi:hypothetical protein